MKLGRRIDDAGNRIFSPRDLVELLYRGVEVDGLIVDPSREGEEFNHNCRRFRLNSKVNTLDDSPTEMSLRWVLPDHYMTLDVDRELLSRCARPDEVDRVNQEMELYRRFDLVDMLRSLFYIVDTMRDHGIVWGVGRGSSVASYVLFLIGVHKIDSIHFGLSLNDFFKTGD